MNPSLQFAHNAAQAHEALGLVGFAILWLVASVCSIGLVWIVGRWLDR